MKASLYPFIPVTLLFLMVLEACGISKSTATGTTAGMEAGALTDYSKPSTWASLPNKADPADRTPGPDYMDVQAEAPLDVFFLHPTTYTTPKRPFGWNAPVLNEKLNNKTDESTILYQASIFNGVGKVYAPRYRQANLQAYFTQDPAAKAAFEPAYEDVKASFEYYLKHYNMGRPFIIASHSQGTTHAVRLIKEFIDGKPLQNQLVAAYLVGMPVPADVFQQVPICETPDQTGCFCSWRTYQKGFYPSYHQSGQNLAVTNPLSWRVDTTYVSAEQNKGAIVRKFTKIFPAICDAQISDGWLWASRPKFPFSFLLRTKNYHIGDFNLFYLNVRENAQLRAKNYLDGKK